MAHMPENRPYHHGDLRAALLQSAERTLREKGAGSLSLRELARETGVSHAAPSRHFKDKQALLNALALAGYDRLAEALAAAEDPTLPLQPRLTALARTYLGFAMDNPELLELMYARKHDPDASEQMTDGVDRTVGSLERVIADAQKRGEIIAGDPRHLMHLTGAAVHGVAAFSAGGWLDPDTAGDTIEGLIHHLLHGLMPR
ncbi:TetR/AcrR family transcriptional regulator [Streptomyces sp. NPDC050619]|uniref:TetR/AcrR family transcriptional regulator n=1 Tax=Streptomyces sp. NPDC050619 TaxID=3157214 RepID=UPI003414B887